MRFYPRPLELLLIVSLSFVGFLPGDLRAAGDTTADCGRFFLKTNPKTGMKECANKQRTRGVTAQGIRRAQGRVQRVLRQADSILRGNRLTQQDKQRVRELLTEVRQRVRDIQRQTAQLRQEQQARDQALQTAQSQRNRNQQEQSRRLEQQQRDLTRQLVAQQNQLVRTLRRGNASRQ